MNLLASRRPTKFMGWVIQNSHVTGEISKVDIVLRMPRLTISVVLTALLLLTLPS